MFAFVCILGGAVGLKDDAEQLVLLIFIHAEYIGLDALQVLLLPRIYADKVWGIAKLVDHLLDVSAWLVELRPVFLRADVGLQLDLSCRFVEVLNHDGNEKPGVFFFDFVLSG